MCLLKHVSDCAKHHVTGDYYEAPLFSLLASGIAAWLMQEVELRGAVPLGFAGAALSGSITAGLLLPWGAKGAESMINDRFYLGGPSDLRGFRTHGVGPSGARQTGTRGRDVLGGDIKLAATAAVSFNLPVELLLRWGIHGHTFATAGTLLPFSATSGIRRQPAQFARDLAQSVSCTCGVGVVLPTFLGRLEVSESRRHLRWGKACRM